MRPRRRLVVGDDSAGDDDLVGDMVEVRTWFCDRLSQMAYNAGIAVIAVDAAYTSRWGAQHWLARLQRHHQTTGHHAAALVIGRRGLGHRARRRVTRNHTAPAEAARSTQTRPRTTPPPRTAPKETRHPDRPLAATRHQDQTTSTRTGRQPGDPRPQNGR